MASTRLEHKGFGPVRESGRSLSEGVVDYSNDQTQHTEVYFMNLLLGN